MKTKKTKKQEQKQKTIRVVGTCREVPLVNYKRGRLVTPPSLIFSTF